MRLKTIYSSPTDKQIYETNKALQRSYGANTPAVTTEYALINGEPQTILEVNPNRKSLTISNPSVSEILHVSFGATSSLTSGFFILPQTSQTISPVSTEYVSVIIDENITISATEL